jgi:glutamyl-tRNA synthetase
MLADLRWLGLDWDEGPDVGGLFGPYVQSMRQALYDKAIARLRDKELIYPCYCTRAELAQIASAPQGDEGPRYPGICRHLTARERAAREATGRRPALRFVAPEKPIQFDDLLYGTISESVAATVGDFIVCRSDGIVSYQLAIVVDDALMDITQVVRGADLLTSTARQLALFDALEYPRPQGYAHVPMVTDASGIRLAKRDAAAGLDTLWAAGHTPGRVLASLAASCGLHPAETSTTPTDLLAAFDPLRLNGLQTPIHLPD